MNALSFAQKLARRENGCWEWTGARDTERGGYGHLRVEGRTVRAHRWAWFLAHDKHPEGFVLHSCDNPPCCNPAHLFVGTAADNSRDMVSKGRCRPYRGEANTNALLTEQAVRAIRANERSESQRAMAHRFGVSRGTIVSVLQRRNWKHVL